MNEFLKNHYWWLIIVLSAFLTAPLLELIVPVYYNAKTFLESFSETFLREHSLSDPAFKLWEMMPYGALLIPGAFLEKRVARTSFNIIILCGYIGLMALTIAAHFSFWADLYRPGINHVSSTSSLIFLFLPPWSVASMIAGLLLGGLIVYIRRKFSLSQ